MLYVSELTLFGPDFTPSCVISAIIFFILQKNGKESEQTRYLKEILPDEYLIFGFGKIRLLMILMMFSCVACFFYVLWQYGKCEVLLKDLIVANNTAALRQDTIFKAPDDTCDFLKESYRNLLSHVQDVVYYIVIVFPNTLIPIIMDNVVNNKFVSELQRREYMLNFKFETERKDVEQSASQKIVSCRKAAEKGDINAQNTLGDCYYNGEGIHQDYIQAAKWYQKAAEQGYAKAQCNLGFIYYNGHGVRKDYVKARQWYEKAAAQGYAKAQYNLGVMYVNGHGVPSNTAIAKKYFGKACDNGFQEGCDAYKKLNKK